jgi:hypothetical protein
VSILDLRTDDSLASAPGYMQPRKPVAPMSWGGLFSAPFRGVTEGLVFRPFAAALEFATSYGDIMARVDDGRSLTDRDILVETDISKAARDAGRSLRPDPETASTAEQIIYGFASGVTRLLAATSVAGPFGLAAASIEEATTTADDLKREGVDLKTRMQAGAVSAAGFSLGGLPLIGSVTWKTAALYVAGGPGGFIAQQALTREILQGAGYDELGDSYDPFDPVGLAVSSLIPAVFTAAGLRAGAKRARVSKEVSDAARVAYEIEQRNATSPVSRDDFAAVAKHAEALAKAEEQVARGEPVQVSDVAPRITPEQRDANFREWFGESKVVDESGAPLVVYHGTARDFESFDPTKFGANTRATNDELGFFFTSKPFLSDNYAELAGKGGWNNAEPGSPVVYPVHLSIKNPKTYKTATEFYRDGDARAGNHGAWREDLIAQGYDGVVVRGDFEEVIVFDPKQAKSAIGNSGKFDPNSASLTDPIAQLGAAVEELRAARAELDGSARPDSPDQVAQPRQPAEANVGTPRDLQAEMISLRKSQAVLNRLLECIG